MCLTCVLFPFSLRMEADRVSIWPRMEPFLLGALQVNILSPSIKYADIIHWMHMLLNNWSWCHFRWLHPPSSACTISARWRATCEHGMAASLFWAGPCGGILLAESSSFQRTSHGSTLRLLTYLLATLQRRGWSGRSVFPSALPKLSSNNKGTR